MEMPVASVMIRNSPSYRMEMFVQGLQVLGYKVLLSPLQKPDKDDLIVIWNRSPFNDRLAKRYNKVIVTENGYIGKAPDGRKLYSLALDHHLGVGRWFVGEQDRWSQLGIELKPWRENGEAIIVLLQRGIGEHGVTMPNQWPLSINQRLRRVTNRPIKIRKHPGVNPCTPLEEDLQGCWAAVTWASGAGIKAIAHGIPVFYDLHNWIGSSAAVRGTENIERPFLGDRLPMFRRLAWAQWSAEEIATGEPFRCLLRL